MIIRTRYAKVQIRPRGLQKMTAVHVACMKILRMKDKSFDWDYEIRNE